MLIKNFFKKSSTNVFDSIDLCIFESEILLMTTYITHTLQSDGLLRIPRNPEKKKIVEFWNSQVFDNSIILYYLRLN